jgi:hypothetical protein
MTKFRLSSDNLYHFKSNVKYLNSILSDGFSHRLWSETIPFKKSEQQNFVVCFCDIPIEDANYHRQCYGDNAIVLTKEWGIQNGVSPVRYIHNNSPGILTNYIKSKNRFREIRQKAKDHEDTIVMDYSIFSILLDSNKLFYDRLDEDIVNNSNLLNEMEALEKEFLKIFKRTKLVCQKKIITKYFRSLINRILDLHNELERRDSFMRVYSEDFTHPSTNKTIYNKILYDEKEWRSVKFAERIDYLEAVKNKCLPLKYNLTFTDSDVLAILLKDQSTLDLVSNYITTNKTLLDPKITCTKLEIIDKYKENNY